MNKTRLTLITVIAAFAFAAPGVASAQPPLAGGAPGMQQATDDTVVGIGQVAKGLASEGKSTVRP